MTDFLTSSLLQDRTEIPLSSVIKKMYCHFGSRNNIDKNIFDFSCYIITLITKFLENQLTYG